MTRAADFTANALDAFRFLVDEHGFRVADQRDWQVRWESASAAVIATFDPRGEIEVRVARLDDETGFGTLTVEGMIGRASADRVLHLLAERLRQNEPALRGDASFFQELAERQQREAKALTAYYAGPRPRPETGCLP